MHPVDAQVLQLLVLVEQTNGNGTKALQDLQKRFSDQPPGSRLELGLLVADVQRQDGQPQAAAKMYAQLAAESPTDSRPQLALALLKRDQGQVQEVQALLQQTRQRQVGSWRRHHLDRPTGCELGVKCSPHQPNKNDDPND